MDGTKKGIGNTRNRNYHYKEIQKIKMTITRRGTQRNGHYRDTIRNRQCKNGYPRNE